MIGAEAEALFAAEAKKRQGARTDIKAKLPEGSKGQARDKAAKVTGASPRYISEVKAIKEKAPELIPEHDSGIRA